MSLELHLTPPSCVAVHLQQRNNGGLLSLGHSSMSEHITVAKEVVSFD